MSEWERKLNDVMGEERVGKAGSSWTQGSLTMSGRAAQRNERQRA